MAKPSTPYYYDTSASRWRASATGRFVSHKQVVSARDEIVRASMQYTDNLAAQLASGNISLQRWVIDMRQQLKQTYINEYMLARGGTSAMTQSDWGRIGHMLRDQYKYLDRLAADIAAGKLSPKQVAVRARMYIDSAVQAHEQGKAAARGLILPAYPGDGQTQCLTNCKCHWEIVEQEVLWECFWRLEAQAEHCPDCVSNSMAWNPYIYPKVLK